MLPGLPSHSIRCVDAVYFWKVSEDVINVVSFIFLPVLTPSVFELDDQCVINPVPNGVIGSLEP
jgi:hypothetical protein